MPQNSMNQNPSGRSERDHDRSEKDARRQNMGTPGLSAGEEDVERGRERDIKSSRSRLSSIDYDRNAE